MSNEVTFLQAIAQGLSEELERDERVFLMGEDIGTYGGAFKVTEGLLEKFGPQRIIDMPISETGFVGAGIGAALMGMRPVIEMQYADFISCAFDQICNEAAKIHYRSRYPVPIVIRGPSGAGLNAGPFHSQSPEAWFGHIAGLKVIVPSTPTDAKGLLKSAIRDDNPVIFFEHKALYRSIREEVPQDDQTIPIGKARIHKEGTDLSIITYGAMTHKALEVANEMQGDVNIEVVDLRTVYPLDKQAIIKTVEKTNKVIILHEDMRTLGVGAEVAAIIAEEAFDSLDGPVIRITAPDTPIPYAPVLEEAFLPQVEDIKEAVNKLAHY